jgi:short-subunit dehydrogenase
MSVKLKPIDQQVIFIAGATSGIGEATVRLALSQGAKVYMVADNEEQLQKIQDEMQLKNLPTAYAVADLTEVDQLQIAADHCLATFGTIDTWINNPGVSLYSRLLETNETDAKQLFDSNFWSVVNGSKVAASNLRASGGTIINIGSVLAKVNQSIQGIYLASKHAVKGYTDSLKRELAAEKAPISVSLITAESSDSAEVIAKMILKRSVTPISSVAATRTWEKSRLFFRNIKFLNRKKTYQ